MVYLILACMAIVESERRGRAHKSEDVEVGGGATASIRMFNSLPLTSVLLLSAWAEGCTVHTSKSFNL